MGVSFPLFFFLCDFLGTSLFFRGTGLGGGQGCLHHFMLGMRRGNGLYILLIMIYIGCRQVMNKQKTKKKSPQSSRGRCSNTLKTPTNLPVYTVTYLSVPRVIQTSVPGAGRGQEGRGGWCRGGAGGQGRNTTTVLTHSALHGIGRGVVGGHGIQTATHTEGHSRQNGTPPHMPRRAERKTAAHTEGCTRQNGTLLRKPHRAERKTARAYRGLCQAERSTATYTVLGGTEDRRAPMPRRVEWKTVTH